MAALEQRYYTQVSAYDIENNDYTVPSGKTLWVYEVGANSAQVEATRVKIIIDPSGTPNILLSCHGDTIQDLIPIECVAGTVIRIECRNDSGQSETIGGFFKGELYG